MRYQEFSGEELNGALRAGGQVKLRAYCQENPDGDGWAVLILPGGGYRVIAPSEGEPVARAFQAAGVQAFVLDYSVLPKRWPQPLLEAAAAMAFLRDHAKEFGFRSDRVAVCGFSAGGHLAGGVTNFCGHPIIKERLGLDEAQVRPNASILCYPVIHLERSLKEIGDPEELRLDRAVGPEHPPAFLWATVADGSVPVENTLDYACALQAQKIPFELHLYTDGPHAMGLADRESARDEAHCNPHAATWHPLCVEWLKSR